MTPELTALALSVILTAAQFLAYSSAATRQTGIKYAAGPRDEARTLTGLAGRLKRALDNQFEGLTLFTAAATIVTLSNSTNPFTAACAWTYLTARLAYAPAYALGWTPWRSAIWAVGFLATLLMVISTLI